jgi:ABC-type branched-subunit amino acid transport system substrate-binding protein
MKVRTPLVVLALLASLTFAFVACSSDNKDNNGNPTATDQTPSGTQTSGESPGVTDTEVILGTHTSLTGPISAYNIIPKFTLAYFDHINTSEGGVSGRKITYLEEDDAYNPSQAVDLTRKLVEQDGIFAMFNALGTPNHLQVIDYLQDKGVPDMFVATGATEWVKDPAARPLVFGSNPNYTGEGLAIGKAILDDMGADVTVGVLYQNDDFGQDGLAGVKLALPTQVTSEQPYEVADPEVNSRIDQMKAADVDVVVLFATPDKVGTAIKHARSDLGWNPQFAITAVSMNEFTSLISGGAATCGITANTDGCLIDGAFGPVATYMGYQTSIPGVQANVDLLSSSGLGGSPSVLTLYAQYVAELMVETLNRAGANLTRGSLIEAAESIQDWKCTICLFPVNLSADDHDPGQAVAIGKFQGGQIVITDTAYSWEGVKVADLALDKLQKIDVPADALTPPP